MTARGYFTVDSYLLRLTPTQMEECLGLPADFFKLGAIVLRLDCTPSFGMWVPVGSTRYPGGRGLRAEGPLKTYARPGEWIGQRLVKVVRKFPTIQYHDDDFPPAQGQAAPQWLLLRPVPVHVFRVLAPGEQYQPD